MFLPMYLRFTVKVPDRVRFGKKKYISQPNTAFLETIFTGGLAAVIILTSLQGNARNNGNRSLLSRGINWP